MVPIVIFWLMLYLSLVEYYINGYNLEAINILSRGMLLYIKSIQYIPFTRSVFIYKDIDPRNNL